MGQANNKPYENSRQVARPGDALTFQVACHNSTDFMFLEPLRLKDLESCAMPETGLQSDNTFRQTPRGALSCNDQTYYANSTYKLQNARINNVGIFGNPKMNFWGLPLTTFGGCNKDRCSIGLLQNPKNSTTGAQGCIEKFKDRLMMVKADIHADIPPGEYRICYSNTGGRVRVGTVAVNGAADGMPNGPAMHVKADGATVKFGPDADVSIHRSGDGWLTTEDNLEIEGDLVVRGVSITQKILQTQAMLDCAYNEPWGESADSPTSN